VPRLSPALSLATLKRLKFRVFCEEVAVVVVVGDEMSSRSLASCFGFDFFGGSYTSKKAVGGK